MKFWFDIEFSYEEYEKLQKARGKKTDMQYAKEAIMEKIDREAPQK